MNRPSIALSRLLRQVLVRSFCVRPVRSAYSPLNPIISCASPHCQPWIARTLPSIMQSILASNGYASPFLGAIMTTDGRFSHFLHKIEQIHHENGYWLFHTAHEEHAYAQGFRTPEHLLLAELRGDGSPDHVHLRWIPGRGDLHNLSRQANAKQHLEDILQERITLGLGGLRMDIVPVYPLDSQGRLWEHRKRKAQSQRSTPQTKPVCARCQSMKRGCDRTRPTCGLCLKAGVTCNYSDEPVSVDARTSSKISSHFGQHESSLHTRGHPYHSTKYVLGACTGAQDSPVQGPNNKPGSTPNTSFANFTSGNQSLSFSDKSPHERSAFTPQNTVYGAVSMNTPKKFSNLVPDQAATSLTTVRNVANFQPSPLVLQHGATRHSEVLPERQVHCTPLSGNNSRRNTSYPSIYVSPYASPVLLPQSSSHGYRGMAPGHGDCTRPSSGTSPAETKSPRFSPPVSGLGVSNQINVLDSRAPSPLVGQEVSCLHEVDTNTYDCEMQEFDDNNTKINNHKLFTSLHEDVHMAGLVTSDDRFASHDLSTSMHQMTFDAFSEALTEPLPCMDCGEPDSHAWDCHIGSKFTYCTKASDHC